MHRYVVETIHDGTDVRVRRALADEVEDPEEETLTHDEATDLARSMVERGVARWWFDWPEDDPFTIECRFCVHYFPDGGWEVDEHGNCTACKGTTYETFNLAIQE